MTETKEITWQEKLLNAIEEDCKHRLKRYAKNAKSDLWDAGLMAHARNTYEKIAVAKVIHSD